MSISSGPAFARPAGVAETLADSIRSRVEQNPQIQCIEIDRAGERFSRSHGELHRRALEILPALLDRVTAGESDLVLCFESALDFIPAAWACIYGGYTFLPWHLTKGPGHDQDVRARLAAIGKRLADPVLVTTEDIKSKVTRPDGSPFRTAICIDRNLPDRAGAVSPARMLALPKTKPAGDAAFLVSTSGTTADAKFAIIEHRCLFDRFLARQVRLSKQARLFCFPFDGITGMQIIYPMSTDSIYLQPGRLAAQPLEMLKLVEDFRLDRFGLSSSMLARILDAAEFAPRHYDLSSLKQVGLGAEMIVPDVLRRLAAQFRTMGAAELKVILAYGMTETGPICLEEKLVDQVIERLDRSGDPIGVGGCIPGWSLRIVDDQGGRLPQGTAGNIEVWSDVQLFSGYRNDPQLNEQSFAQDGWFRTGDLGVMEDGALTIMGRQKATIIVNARKISLESVEAPLRRMDSIRGSLVAAAAVRSKEGATDELAVFFAPRDNDNTNLDTIYRRISQEIGRHSGVPVKHFVPVSEADFPLTATGKIRRDELVRLYQSGVLAPHIVARSDGSSATRPLTDTERWLTELWKKVLRLESPPSPEDDFFELGGDSLASAELIFAVEEMYSCELPIEAFFRHPTIATMSKLVAQHEAASPPQSPARPADGGYRLLHKLQSFTGSWPGERLFADSLVVGLNRGGRRAPIFLICQEREEFLQLAKHLGPDQPLYGMRSCVGIVSVKNYSTDVIDTVCNRYLWEILALPVKPPYFVVGVCQAGIFAMALARRLKQIGRTPPLLILLEWAYSRGRYTEPTLLLYGDQSPIADIYLKPGTRAPNWREDFSEKTVAAVPGAHGTLFVDENIAGLVEVIRRHVRPSGDVNPV